MNNAEKFKQIFGLYATELWSMPESDFLEWLNRDVETTQIDHTADTSKNVEGDCISRQAAIDALDEQIEQCNKALGSFNISPKDEYAIKAEKASLKAYKEQLENMPSVQPGQVCVANVTLTDEQVKEVVEKAKNAVISVIELEPHWIPCSERLPEDEYVLISKKPSKISGDKWCVTIAIRTADPRSGKIQWRDIGFGVIQDDKVLAWMPLPEPYRGGEKE